MESGESGVREALATVSATEAVLVHAPVLLFVIPLQTALILAAVRGGTVRLIALLLAWWLASGAVMMCVDGRERMRRYSRLVRVASGRQVLHPTHTICGWFLLQAIRHRASRRVATDGAVAEATRRKGVGA